jgi:putative sugar O-methyltransferase
LRYLHENGLDIPVGFEGLLDAAAGGHLDVLIYLHQNGADIGVGDGEALVRAAAHGHAHVIEYLHSNGVRHSLLRPESRRQIAEMEQEITGAAEIYQPSRFWTVLNQSNSTMLEFGGEENFKRTINQNYFNFVPTSLLDPKILNLIRLWTRHPSLRPLIYGIKDPDQDPDFWVSWYDRYFIFQGNRARGRWLYKVYVGSLHEYGLASDRTGTLARLAEPEVGRPIQVLRQGRLVSQDLVNSVREWSAIAEGLELSGPTLPERPRVIGELGAGYGRLGYVLLSTTPHRYMVFDIPPALHVSQWYLSQLFPNRRLFRFRHFRSYEQIADELEQCDLAFFTANQLEFFPDGMFDAFATISSLHEMHRTQIDHFLELMAAKTRHVIFLKQHTSYVNPHDGLRIDRSEYRLPASWRVVRERADPLNPGFFERLALNSRPVWAAGQRAARRHDPPTVSVLLCNYNHARYLPESLGAICEQSRPPDECIVVDDGSTDDSVLVIEEFARRYPFVVFLRNARNEGLMSSIRTALGRASKEYIVWAAADDRLLPSFLERSLAALARHPEAGLCFSRLAVFADDTDQVREYVGDARTGSAFDLGRETHALTPEALRERLVRSYLWMSGNTVVARREAVLAEGGFPAELRWHAEWFVYYVIALRYGAVVIPETLALMREGTGAHGSAGMWDPIRQRPVLGAMVRTLKSLRYRDVAETFRARPMLLSPFGGLMLRVLATNPSWWDLGWRYLYWTLAHWAAVYQGRATAPGKRWLTLVARALRLTAGAVGALTPSAWQR